MGASEQNLTAVTDASQCSGGCANWGECVSAQYGYICNLSVQISDEKYQEDLCSSINGEFIHAADNLDLSWARCITKTGLASSTEDIEPIQDIEDAADCENGCANWLICAYDQSVCYNGKIEESLKTLEYCTQELKGEFFEANEENAFVS